MIIDSHFHYGYMAGYMNYDTGLESVIDLMDGLEIRYAVNSNTFDLTYGDFEGAAEENIELFNKTNGRIMSYFAYNPFKSKKCMEVISKYYDGKIFKGIKIHPSWHQVSADDESYDMIWKCAAENDIIIIAHTWDISLTNPVQKFSFPSRFEKYLRKYPEVRFICAHSGGRYKGIVHAASMAKKFRNMYLDTAGDIYANYFVEYLVNQIGSEKVLFGTDYGMMDQRNMLGIILGSNIKVKDKENILFNNASKLFGINI